MRGQVCCGFYYETLMHYSLPEGYEKHMGTEPGTVCCGPSPLLVRVPVRRTFFIWGGSAKTWKEHYILAARGHIAQSVHISITSARALGHVEVPLPALQQQSIPVNECIAGFRPWFEAIEGNPDKDAFRLELYDLILEQQRVWELRWGDVARRMAFYDEWARDWWESGRKAVSAAEWAKDYASAIEPLVAESRKLAAEMQAVVASVRRGMSP